MPHLIASSIERGAPTRMWGLTHSTWKAVAMAASIVIVIAAIGFGAMRRDSSSDPIARAFAAERFRPLQGRLSGMPAYAPARNITPFRGRAQESLPIEAAVSETLVKSNDPRRIAIARLIHGDSDTSVEMLTRSASQSQSSAPWSDLA